MTAQKKKIVNLAFVGKTVKSIDTSSANCWIFHFTDGTSVLVDTEAKGHGLYGPVVYEDQLLCPEK